VNGKRRLVVALLVAGGFGCAGCQSPSLGGLAFWKKSEPTGMGAGPNSSSQNYDGLAKEFGTSPQPFGTARSGKTPMGGTPAASDDNFMVASWKKTTAAVSGAFAAQPDDAAEDDPLRLDSEPKKMGPEVYVGAARLYENQQKFVEAEEAYNKALEIAPNDANALVGLARMHDRQGNPTKAIEFYHRAIKADPKSALAYNDLGLCFARQKQLDKALQCLGTAVRLQDDNPKYRNNLASVLVEAGRTEEAFKQLSVGGSPAVAHYNVGYLLQQRGDRSGAIQQLQQALAMDPTLLPARQMLAQLGGQTATAPQPAATVAARPQYGPAQTYAPAGTYGSYGAAPVAAPQVVPATTESQGSAFHVSDDASPASDASYYGGPRHLPPVE
jgi:Tfp pilus assembly protein PilF